MIVTRKRAKELLGPEAVNKPKFSGKRWFLLSKSMPHRNLGAFDTKGEASEHERAVQYFKHANPEPKGSMRKKLRKNAAGELRARPKSKQIRRETALGAKGIKEAVEAGKLVFLESLSFPQPQVVGVKIKAYPDSSGAGADYYGLLRLDTGKTERLDGLKRLRVVVIDEPQHNPMMTTTSAAGQAMNIFKLSPPEKKLLERHGIDPWDLVGQRPEALHRMISGLQMAEVASSGPVSDADRRSLTAVGKTYSGWTLNNFWSKNDNAKFPIKARLSRESKGRKLRLIVMPSQEPSLYMLVLKSGATKAVAKTIRVRDLGEKVTSEAVKKLLCRAGREASSWVSGKGAGWKVYADSALPNPSRHSKKWAEEFEAELKDLEHRKDAARELAKAKEDVILFLAGEPGAKPEAEKYSTVVRHGDDTELTIMAVRSLIEAGVIKKVKKGKQDGLVLTPTGVRYSIALEKRMENMLLDSGLGADYEENPKKRKRKSAKKRPKKNPIRKRPFAWDGERIAKSPFKSKASAKRAETLHKMGEGIGSTQAASLKAMGRLPRSHGGYELGKKYQ